jgi:hypothetical protein
VGTTSEGIEEVVLEAYGVRFTLSATDPGLRERVASLAPPGAVPVPAAVLAAEAARAAEIVAAADEVPADDGSSMADGAPTADSSESDDPGLVRFSLVSDGEVYRVRENDADTLASHDLELAIRILSAHVVEFVAFHSKDWVFIKGGAVLHDGCIIGILGPSLSGRSTLVEELVRAGASPWSDGYVLVDRGGAIHPYSAGSQDRRPAPLAAMVVTQYRPGAVWSPHRGSGGDAVLALLANAVGARERPAETMAVARRAAAGVVVLQGERGEAREMATKLLESVASEASA